MLFVYHGNDIFYRSFALQLLNIIMTIQEALDQNTNGYYIGNRLILPFSAQIIKWEARTFS